MRVAQHGDFEAREQVVAAVAAQHAKRNLAAGEHYRFAKGPSEHEAQGARAVGHGVGTVEQHKAVVVVARFPKRSGHGSPVIRAQIRGVLGLPEASAIYLSLEPREVRHVGAERLRMKGNQAAVALGDHANGSAGIKYEKFHSPKICCALRLVTSATSASGIPSSEAKCSATRRR